MTEKGVSENQNKEYKTKLGKTLTSVLWIVKYKIKRDDPLKAFK